MKEYNWDGHKLANESFALINMCESFFLAAVFISGLNEIISFGVNNYILYFLFQDHPT